MRTLSTISKTLMWISLVIYLLFQTLAIISLMDNNAHAISSEQPDKVYDPVPLLIGTVLMLLAVIMFTIMKRRRYIGVILAVISALVMLVVALDLGRTFPVVIGTDGMDKGLSTWKLIWRHIGIAVVPIFMLFGWLAERKADKAIDELFADKKGYDLSGAALFKDDGDGDREQPVEYKPKRSVRKKMEKDNRQSADKENI